MNRSAIILPLLAAACAASRAQGPVVNLPLVSAMFSDHMVIQRDIPVPVWGWTVPGMKVTVRMGDQTATATANAEGRWETRLDKFPAGGPYTITVTGPHTETIKDVLVGDVWVCSGQSNMEMSLASVRDAAQEMAKADYPKIRLYHLQRQIAMEPMPFAIGEWKVCSPQFMREDKGSFSAVAYFFGRKLYQDLKVPIGLIDTSWGGTIAEAWTSAQGLRPLPFARPALEAFERSVADRKSNLGLTFDQQMDEWWTKNDPGSSASPTFADAAYDAGAWKSMTLPTAWEDAGLPNYDGVVWFRREVTVPDGAVGKAATLHLGPIDDRDSTFVNGVKVGSWHEYMTPRTYQVPAGTLKAGRNVIAVRVLDTGGAGGLYGQPDQMHLDIEGEAPIPLNGPWQYSDTVPLSRTAPAPQSLDDNPNLPTVLYNGMIAPIVPFGIKGAIWYQGESNAGQAYNYRTLMPTMINDWRTQWNQGNFPFFMVQLANYTDPPAEPGDSDWAELREAQTMTAQHLVNTGMAVIIDIGEAKDIHPKNKQDVGKRLALAAEKIAYDKDVEYSGPMVRSLKNEGNAIRLSFDHVDGGLVAKGDKLTGFAIAGKDRKFVWADARIDGDTVVVSSPQVPEPVAVRYAWANNPVCNLYNKAGLPASPFRTDAWKGITGGPDGPDVAPPLR